MVQIAPERLSDYRIDSLVQEAKPLPKNYRVQLTQYEDRGHHRAELGFRGVNGSEFFIKLRRLIANPLDFSVILGYEWRTTGKVILLRRYNGRSHEHANKLEGGPRFFDFHVHYATERYQRSGFKPEHYAEVDSRYVDLRGAFECLVKDCNLVIPSHSQIDAFGESLL